MKKVIILFLVLLMITGCGGAANNTSTKDSSKEKIKEEKFTLSADQEFKLATIIKNISFNKKFNFNQLSNEEKLRLIYFIAMAEYYKDNSHPYSEDYLNKINFEKVTRDYFGPDAKIVMDNIPCCDYDLFIYDSTTGKYTMNENHGGHGYSDRQIIKKLVDVVKKGDIVSVNYKLGFSSYVDIGLPEGFYTSIESANENYMTPDIDLFEYCWGDDVSYDCDYDKMFEENDFEKYTFNFKIDGDKFYFIGYNKER